MRVVVGVLVLSVRARGNDGGGAEPQGWITISTFSDSACAERPIATEVEQYGMCTDTLNTTIARELTNVFQGNLVTSYFADNLCKIPMPHVPNYIRPLPDGSCKLIGTARKDKTSQTTVVTQGPQPPLPEFTAIMTTGYRTIDACKTNFPVTGYFSYRREICIDDFATNSSTLHECDLDEYSVKTFEGLQCEDDDWESTRTVPVKKCDGPDTDAYSIDDTFTNMRCYSPPPIPANVAPDSAAIGGVAAFVIVVGILLGRAFVNAYRSAKMMKR